MFYDRTKRALVGLAVIGAITLIATIFLIATIVSNDHRSSHQQSSSTTAIENCHSLSSNNNCAGGDSGRLSEQEKLKKQPTTTTTPYPTKEPTCQPTTASPSDLPSFVPSNTPSFHPTPNPTSSPTILTFVPGNLTHFENGLILSQGLASRIFAKSGERVLLDKNRGSSEARCHILPDYGTTFFDLQPDNEGGWIYVSNCEDRDKGQGGVGAFTFDADGDLVDYRMILTGTTANCGGGPTPWGTYVSCEETNGGVNWQVDPTGQREPEIIRLGNDGIGGRFESFAYDLYTDNLPQFFVTEDKLNGALQRFRPDDDSDWDGDPWKMLHGEGMTDYLVLSSSTGRFTWSRDREAAMVSAEKEYPNSEGIDCVGGILYFISKLRKMMFILDLHDGTYTSHSTERGTFDAQPDQVARILHHRDDLLFFTEDGGRQPGIHARNQKGEFFPILEGTDENFRGDETTGLAFSPDGMHLYFAIQDAGFLYDITRTDGLPFHSKTLNVKYHTTEKR